MKKNQGNVWDLSKKKWIYWISLIGFILFFNFLIWGVTVVLYLIFDRKKPKTKNYKISKVYEKYIIIIGSIGMIWFIIKVILFYLGFSSSII